MQRTYTQNISALQKNRRPRKNSWEIAQMWVQSFLESAELGAIEQVRGQAAVTLGISRDPPSAETPKPVIAGTAPNC